MLTETITSTRTKPRKGSITRQHPYAVENPYPHPPKVRYGRNKTKRVKRMLNEINCIFQRNLGISDRQMMDFHQIKQGAF